MQKDVDQLKAEIEQGVNIDSVTIKLNGIALGAIRKNENNQIIQYIEPVVQAYREEVKSDLNEFGYLSYYLGLAHTNLGNYLNAIPFCEEAEFIAETKQEQDTLLRMQRKIILSHLYSSTGQLKKARQVNKEGLTLASALGNPIYEFRYLINSGNTYQYMGEFNYALSHCKRAIEVVHQSLGDPALLAAAYTNMGASYLSSNQPEEAIKALRKASGFDPNTNNENPEQIYDRLSTIIRYSDLAKAYTKLEVLDSAYIYANKAVTNIKEVFPDGHAFVGDFLLDLGIAYAKKGEFDQARERMKQSIAISDKSLGNVNIASGQAYSNMADTYLEEEDYETAHDLYGKALGAVFKEYSSNVQGPDLLPSKDAVTISPIDAISILHKKAKAYEKEYNEDTSKSKLLQRTNETYTIIIHFIQRFKGDLNDVESRILFSSTFKEIFGEAIASAQQLYVLEQND
ncbi:MAG: tetratricopeptide repeat protein, partial [Bacteroidota bacterium]